MVDPGFGALTTKFSARQESPLERLLKLLNAPEF